MRWSVLVPVAPSLGIEHRSAQSPNFPWPPIGFALWAKEVRESNDSVFLRGV